MTTQFHTAVTVDQFADNLRAVRARMAAAAERAGRKPDEVRLLPVSKTVPEDRIRNAVAAGMTNLGENKVQEAHRKWQNLDDLSVDWSIIGHLQTNKAKFVAEFATEFQALSSLKMAAALDRRLQQLGRSLDVFVQVNTSREPQKFGLAPEEVGDFLQQMPQFSALRVKGFMTLAVFSADTEQVRSCFQVLKTVRAQARQSAPEGVSVEELSMGMSGDFETAIEEGATVVRVGQAIFGARTTPDSMYWPGLTDPAGSGSTPKGQDA